MPPTKPRNRVGFLRGGLPADCNLTLAPSTVRASEGDSGPPVTGRRFRLVAYTGVRMRPLYWGDDVVVDLDGVEVAGSTYPLLLDHWPDVENVLGQTDKVTVAGGIVTAEGEIVAVGEDARGAVALADAGYKFQASIGLAVLSAEYVERNASASVNGRDEAGPVVIVRKSRLKEISATVLGADDATSFDLDGPAPAEPAAAETVSPTADAPPAAPTPEPVAASSSSSGGFLRTLAASATLANPEAPMPAPTMTAEEIQKTARAAAQAEYLRAAAINRLCAGHPAIAEKAFGEGWDVATTELEVLRAGRGTVNNTQLLGSAGGRTTPKTLEAALCIKAGVRPELLEPEYGKDVLHEAMGKEVRGNASLAYLLNAVLAAHGEPTFFGKVTRDHLRAAFDCQRHVRASSGAGNYTLTGVLSSVANKTLLASFLAVDSSALKVFGKASVSDFKTVERYQVTAGGTWEKVGKDGQLKAGDMTEEKFTAKAETYGQYMGVSRQDFINDDLGVFGRMGQALGRNAMVTVQKVAFAKWLSPRSGFYHANNKNLISGGTSALSIGGLVLGVQKFDEQVDAKGTPIVAMAKYLLVPPALKTYSLQLYRDTTVNETTTADKPKPNSNPHVGLYEPLSTVWIGAAGGLGGTDTNWFLASDPADMCAVELTYLDGVETPTVESAELDHKELGVGFRGYIDFGANDQNHRAAVKSAGA